LRELHAGGQAHATFDAAVKDFPPALRGKVPEHLPYSAWQLIEHMRIVQRDILDFSSNEDGRYKAMKWPDEYWPKESEPPNDDVWEESLAAIRKDREMFEKLLAQADDEALISPFAWGEGQTLLRQALLIADHDAYHVGELIVLRRLLGTWNK
jgi:uncharacterized damage-inducible protein DinB